MSAINMKKAGQSVANVDSAAAGAGVNYSPFSGPTNSPFDARTITGWPASTNTTAGVPTYANNTADRSTGALSTGIGFGTTPIINPTAPASIKAAGFTDDYVPGQTLPAGTLIPTSPAAQTPPYLPGQNGTDIGGAVLTCIGGGKSTANVDGIAPTVPYAAQPILNMGNGGSRDAGAGAVKTGFAEKMVTATATVAVGDPVETGFVNRSNRSVVAGESVFGSATAASPAVT